MIADLGELEILAYAVNAAQPGDLVLRLFANDWVPTADDDASRYAEVRGGGYAAVPLRGQDWQLDAALRAAVHPEVTFAFSAALGAVYGYYVTRAGSGEPRWAERFTDGPYRVARAGDRLTVVPGLALKDIEDSEEGIPHPTTHTHNTSVELGGIAYARVIEILAPYTITFQETGTPYVVRLTGSNNNVLERTNLGTVQLLSNNSAGLIEIGTGLTDAQDAALTAVKTKTDQLAFTKANEVDTNLQSVDGLTIAGAGTAANPWRPS